MKEIVVGIGGAAGEGIGRTGDSLALLCARQGIHVFAYNSYQSVIRGGHVWLRLRVSQEKVLNHGDKLHVLIALNKDTYERHLGELEPGGILLYNSESVRIQEGDREDVHYHGIPARTLCKDLGSWKPVMQNTVLLGALVYLLKFPFEKLEEVTRETFGHKGEEVVQHNVNVARKGYEYAREHFPPIDHGIQPTDRRFMVTTGNELFALGAVAAGCKFYSAYPMTPASAILHWFAKYGPEIGVVVKQCEDEIAVINMAIGAGFAGVRALCATSGGGFALMTEAIGMAGMTETPVVVINVMRGGPSTGLPTKTEQGDFWQVFGASQGDYPRMILAPTDIVDCYYSMAEAFNVAEKYQMPVIILSDLYLSEHRETVDPQELKYDVPIDRGELLDRWDSSEPYLRYKYTETGISPRILPGTPGVWFQAPSDEHDERSVLISDVFTNPEERKKMMEKRMKKVEVLKKEIKPVEIYGDTSAGIALVGWGSTKGILLEVQKRLAAHGVQTKVVMLKHLFPLHRQSIEEVFKSSEKVVVVEQNYSGQIERLIKSETGLEPTHRIHKYDGEPMEPSYVIEALKEVLS